MRPFAYSAPSTLPEALAMLGGSARPLAGGTDLITLMKSDLTVPERLVAVRGLLPRGVSAGAQEVIVGAATTLAEIERDAVLTAGYTALAQAAAAAASTQLRNMATLGGNLLQRPRCWYFRNPEVRCWLKGGDVCQAREGENRQHAVFGSAPCVAVHPSDLAAALLAFDAGLRARGPDGERVLSLDEFFAMPEDGRRTETTLKADELILSIRMPAHPGETRSVYLKAMDRQAFAFALAGVAVVVRLAGDGRIGHARVVLSGVASIPWRARGAEQLLSGARPSATVFKDAAEAAVQGAAPLRHNAWKIPLTRTLVTRALQTLMEHKA